MYLFEKNRSVSYISKNRKYFQLKEQKASAWENEVVLVEILQALISHFYLLLDFTWEYLSESRPWSIKFSLLFCTSQPILLFYLLFEWHNLECQFITHQSYIVKTFLQFNIFEAWVFATQNLFLTSISTVLPHVWTMAGLVFFWFVLFFLYLYWISLVSIWWRQYWTISNRLWLAPKPQSQTKDCGRSFVSIQPATILL